MWVILELEVQNNNSRDIWKFENGIGDNGIIFLGMIMFLCRTVLILRILGMLPQNIQEEKKQKLTFRSSLYTLFIVLANRKLLYVKWRYIYVYIYGVYFPFVPM